MRLTISLGAREPHKLRVLWEVKQLVTGNSGEEDAGKRTEMASARNSNPRTPNYKEFRKFNCSLDASLNLGTGISCKSMLSENLHRTS